MFEVELYVELERDCWFERFEDLAFGARVIIDQRRYSKL